jgi:hypothetical protein
MPSKDCVEGPSDSPLYEDQVDSCDEQEDEEPECPDKYPELEV